MKRGLDIRLLISFVVIAFLLSTAYRQHGSLKEYRRELQDRGQRLKAQEEELEELGSRLAYYEQPGDGICRHGKLRVEGGSLVDSRGERLQLRGVSSHGLTWFPRYTNAAALGFWKEAGANVFRAAMYSDQHRGYVYYPEESANYLYLAVENALSLDMYAIVDWHILRDANPLEHMEEAKVFFSDVSSHYGNHPGILYEICNEPNGDTTWEDITEYAHEIIPLIRHYAPDAVILVGMPEYCTEYRPVLEAPLPYGNIMYTYHQYVDGDNKAYDAHGLETMLENRLPIFVSEWGIDSEDEEDVDFRAAEEFLGILEEEKVSWVAWALSNKSGSHALIRPEIRRYGDFSAEDLSGAGRYVYDRLRQQTPRVLGR